MADNTINVRIKDRSDTEANWTSKNPVLLKGERAITDGTGKYKIGDGKNTWGALPYYEAMTSADRTKLNGIASGANKTTVDSSLSSSSTNPVQNKVVNSALAGKSNTNHTHDLSTMINTLSTGSATPTDEDYFVSQYVGGGTTTTTYHRRPVKALLEYIRGKFAKVATSGSYDDLSNKPTIGNGTVTITQGGTSKGTFTLNQTGNTTIALTDNNSWRGVQNNLTSTSTTDSLSAAQGKILNERTYQMRGDVIDNTTDFNTITSVGCYKVQMVAWGAAATYHSPNSYYASLYSYGLLTVDRAFNDGENRLIQIYYPHQSGNAANGTILTRMYNGSAWNAWDSITKGALDWSRILNKPSTFTPSSHSHDNSTITSLDAGKITTGTIDIARLPQGALERCVIVADDTARFKLTKSNIQKGDTVKVTGTGKMYFVIDDTKLTSEDGYTVYTAGSATSVPWSGITGKPSTFTPATHNHNIESLTNFSNRIYDATISRTANTVLAAPNGSNGAATFRKLVSADLPGNYAGSSSAGGAANSAVKLATARTVSNTEDFVMSFSYDGSANSNASLRYYNSRISIGNTNNYPYHRFAKIDTQTSSYIDKTSTFLITQDYNGGGWGIVRISLRTNNSSSVSTVEAKWLVRCGLDVDCIQIGLYNVFGKTYADAFFKTSGTYTGTVIRNLASGARGNISRTWILTDSAEANSTTISDKKTSTESYASTSAAATTLHSQAYTSVVVASDGGTVSYANSAGNASKVNNHTVNSDVPSGAKFTDTVYSHPTTSGNKHIPSGGSSGQILRWSSDGTAVWGNDNNTTYTLSSITGTLAVSKGGTGSTTASGGRSNLGAVGFVCQSAEPSGQNNGDLWFKEE